MICDSRYDVPCIACNTPRHQPRDHLVEHLGHRGRGDLGGPQRLAAAAGPRLQPSGGCRWPQPGQPRRVPRAPGS